MKLTISGCEDYYDPAAKKKKAELASSLGADLKSDEFSMFIKLLKNSGVQCESATRVKSFFSKTDTTRVVGGTNGKKKNAPEKTDAVEHRSQGAGRSTYAFRGPS